MLRALAAAGNQAVARAAVQRQDHGPVLGPPTGEHAAEAALSGAARVLSVPNFIYPSVNHTNAVAGMTLGRDEQYMLFEFWLAAAGRETREGPAAGASGYRRATAAERLARLERGDAVAEGLVRQLGPAPWPGTAGDAVRAYRAAYAQARTQVLDDAVEAALEAQPTALTYEGPEFELEQQRRAVEDLLGTLDQYAAVTARLTASTAARFGTEIRTELARIAAAAPRGSRLAAVAGMPIPEAILHTRGVLNGLNVVLQITDDDRRRQLLAAEFNVTDVAEITRVVLGALEGLVAVTCLIGSAVARLRGNAELASKLFRLGANEIVRRIGWVAALAQTVHGISVVFFDEDATENERLQGVFDIALGSAGLTGAAATLGVEALAGIAGPLTAGIVITAAEVAYLRGQIRGMERGMATGGIRESFDIVEYEAGGIAHAANELAEAIRYSRDVASGPAAVGGPGELAAAGQREVQFKSTRLREWLVRSIERVTERQPEFAILFQPASWTHVRAPFVALRADLARATTPDALLRVASAYLEAARDLFRHFERTIARTLISVDRTREGGFLPHILGGLHSDLEERAAGAGPQHLPVP